MLIVGIADNGEVIGLEKDFDSLGKKRSWDEWVQHFVNVFNEYIGKEFMSFIKIKCIYYNERPVAIIHVKKNNSGPTYIEPKSKGEFYIRSGTTTQLLNPKETVAYTKQHWGV
jgi:predicted HTH transcriptional regulator